MKRKRTAEMSEKEKSLFIRTRSAVVICAISTLVIILGGYWLFATLLGISLLGMFELYRVVGIQQNMPAHAGYIACIAWYVVLLLYYDDILSWVAMPLLVTVFIIALLGIYVFRFPKYNSEQITMAFFGFFYVALTISYIYRLRMGDCGIFSTILVFIGSWGADCGAYLFGSNFGHIRIAPKLSPKKSLEGCIGGLFTAALLGFLFALAFKDTLSQTYSNPLLMYTLICVVASAVSLIGDLAASAIKRDKGIKDYGKLIPGHGGILDRFDSVIFVAPAIFFMLYFFS